MNKKFAACLFAMFPFAIFPVSTAFAQEANGEEPGMFLTLSLSILSLATLIYFIVSMFKDNN